MPAARFRSECLSVYIFDNDYDARTHHQTRTEQELDVSFDAATHRNTAPNESVCSIVLKYEGVGVLEIKHLRHTRGYLMRIDFLPLDVVDDKTF